MPKNLHFFPFWIILTSPLSLLPTFPTQILLQQALFIIAFVRVVVAVVALNYENQ
jgi:hypothetical protein